MSGVLPAPLIIFSTFVGYIAGGLGGAFAMTVGIFIPAFVFPIYFHRWLVAVAENPRIRPFLLGVAAGVIGLIAAVTVDILDTSIVDVPTAVLAVAAFLALNRYHGKLTIVQKTCAIASRDLSGAGQAEVNRSRVLLPHGCESQCPSRDVCRSAWKALAGGSRDTALEDVARERGSDLADV
jgi:hypothetical protein